MRKSKFSPQQIAKILKEFDNASKQKIIESIKELQNQGAQGVILGCTELPILISELDIDIPIFDTGKIHAYKAVEWSLEN